MVLPQVGTLFLKLTLDNLSDKCHTVVNMIHKHVTMRDFLRNPSDNLPKGMGTTLITRNTPTGLQTFALSAVNFQNSGLNSNTDATNLVNSIGQTEDTPAHVKEE